MSASEREFTIKCLKTSIELFKSKDLEERLEALRGDEKAAANAADKAQKQKLKDAGIDPEKAMAAFRSAGTTFKDDKEVMELLMLCAQLEERAVAKSSDPHGTAKLEGLMARAQEEMMRIQHDPSLSPEAKQAKVMEVLQKVQLESMKAMPSMPTPQQMMGAPVAGVPGAVPFAPLGMPPMMPGMPGMPGMPPMMPGMMPGMPPMMPGMPGMPGMAMPPGMDGSPFNAPGQMRMKDE